MTTLYIHRMFLEMWNGGLNLELTDIIRHKRRYLSRNNWSCTLRICDRPCRLHSILNSTVLSLTLMLITSLNNSIAAPLRLRPV